MRALPSRNSLPDPRSAPDRPATSHFPHGNWQLPVLGLPDCNNDASAVGQPVVEATPFEEREVYDQLQEAGVPIPESYAGTAFTGVEETAALHLMAVRIGDIAATFCPCEQFTDGALNIQSRLNKVAGDVWKGWDWTTQKRPDGTDFGQQNAHTDLGGEAEPADPARIKGSFTHREITEYGAQDGYGLTVAVGMANDYFGYQAGVPTASPSRASTARPPATPSSRTPSPASRSP